MPLDISSLKQAIASLKRAIAVANEAQESGLTTDQRETIKAGVIQNFEFTYELCWKFMKRWLGKNYSSSYIDGVTRKELFRIAAENKLLKNAGDWFGYHSARNKTSHAYDAAVAEDLFEISKKFLSDATDFLRALEERND